MVWSATVGSGIQGMPVVTDQVIVAASSDRFLQTMSRHDGSVFWRKKLDGPAVSPLLIGDEIYIATEAKGRLVRYNMEKGKRVWRQKLASVSAPIWYAGDTLFVATDDGFLHVYADSDDEEPLWYTRFPRPPSGGPVVLDQHVAYLGLDSLYVVNRASGIYEAVAAIPEIISGEVAADDSTLYLATEGGSIIAFSAPDLDLLWQTSGFDAFMAGPVLSDGFGFVATRYGELIRFSTADGSSEIIAHIEGTILAPPTVVENGVLVGELSGQLYFFTRDGTPVWNLGLDGAIEAPVIVHEGRILVPMYGRTKGPLGSNPTRGKIVELR
jgi:outer membrane protein assembly factor BamB